MSELGSAIAAAKKSGTTEHNEAIKSWERTLYYSTLLVVGILLMFWIWIYIIPGTADIGRKPLWNLLTDKQTTEAVESENLKPSQPPIYKDGDVLRLNRGGSQTIWLAGEIIIPNHTRGDCVTASPISEVGMDGNKGLTNIWAWPRYGEKVLVTFYLRIPGQINEAGEVTCPHLRQY